MCLASEQTLVQTRHCCRGLMNAWLPFVLHAELLVWLQQVMLPLLLPGSSRVFYPLAPEISRADRTAVDNVVKISNFLTGAGRQAAAAGCLFALCL